MVPALEGISLAVLKALLASFVDKGKCQINEGLLIEVLSRSAYPGRPTQGG